MDFLLIELLVDRERYINELPKFAEYAYNWTTFSILYITKSGIFVIISWKLKYYLGNTQTQICPSCHGSGERIHELSLGIIVSQEWIAWATVSNVVRPSCPIVHHLLWLHRCCPTHLCVQAPVSRPLVQVSSKARHLSFICKPQLHAMKLTSFWDSSS